MLQRGKRSGRFVFYPRIAEPGSGEDLEWVEASGLATVHSVTVVSAQPDYNVCLIDLAEGPRLMSSVVGIEHSQIQIGMKVRANIIKVDSKALLVFEPIH